MGSRPHLGPVGLLSRQVMNLECRREARVPGAIWGKGRLSAQNTGAVVIAGSAA